MFEISSQNGRLFSRDAYFHGMLIFKGCLFSWDAYFHGMLVNASNFVGTPITVCVCTSKTFTDYMHMAYDNIVSYPDPTLSRGKGTSDHSALSWLCQVSSLDSEQAN